MRQLRELSSLLLFVPVMWSQDFRAGLTGIVTDPAGAAVPHAKITARSAETNAVSEAVTSESGRYSISFLIPGKYTVEVEASGFKRFVRENVELQISVRSALDITLQLGGLNEKVTVSTQLSLLETETASRGGIVTTCWSLCRTPAGTSTNWRSPCPASTNPPPRKVRSSAWTDWPTRVRPLTAPRRARKARNRIPTS